MQSAGLDQTEIGDQRALHLQILDAADEVGERWVEFLDHRRVRAMVGLGDHDVHLEPFQRAAEAHDCDRIGRRFLRGGEQMDVFQQIVGDFVDMRQHAGQVGERGLYQRDRVFHGEASGFALQCQDGIPLLLLQSRHAAQRVLQILFQRFDGCLHGELLFARPGIELLGRDDLAVPQRRHGEAGGRAQEWRCFVPAPSHSARRKQSGPLAWIACSAAPRCF